MIRSESGELWFSSQDLTTYLSCHHAAALNRTVLDDESLREWRTEVKRRDRDDALAHGFDSDPPHIARGNRHEADVLASYRARGLRVEDCTTSGFTEADIADGYGKTLDAMAQGVDVVYQGTLLDAPWFGFSDFLIKVPGVPSRFGDFAYELHDTKLARSLHVAALIQLAHYGLILEQMQEVAPPRLVVVLGTGKEAPWAYDDAAPYVAELRKTVREFHASGSPTAPEPVAACLSCAWLERCEDEWGPDDLSRVHRLNGRQRSLLIEAGICTTPQLATAADSARPPRIGTDTFVRLRAQAAVQAGSVGFEIVRPQLSVGALHDVPAPHANDIYFDLEGDPFAAIPTLDYLWAFCNREGHYEHTWAHDLEQERAAFLWFMDHLRSRDAEGGEWHVYHYNSYETASLRRIADAWPDPDEGRALRTEVDDFISRRFDDLYRRVEAGVRTQDGSTSLKVVEKLAGYDRQADPAAVAKGDDSIRVYEMALEAGVLTDAGRELLEGIRQYNRHDVKATLAVHDWLAHLAAGLTDADLIPVDVSDYVPSDRVLARAEATETLETRLISAADEAERAGAALASGLSHGGARLLASLLAWHRREEVVQWVDFYRLCEWARSGEVESDESVAPEDGVEQLIDELATALDATSGSSIRPGTEHESVLQDLVVDQIAAPEGRRRKKMYTVSCRPGAWKVKAGDTLRCVLLTEPDPQGQVAVESCDAQAGAAVLSTTADLSKSHALVMQPFSGSDAPWQALMRLAEEAMDAKPCLGSRVALGVLDRRAPESLKDVADAAGDDRQEWAREIAASLVSGEVLPIQGPPGTGKTHLAADVILDEVNRSQGGSCRIGVTANSHKVIDNLLSKVMEKAAEAGISLEGFHVDSKDDPTRHPDVMRLSAGSEIVDVLARANPGSSVAIIVGATKYGWSRAELVDSIDLMVIDEAGQVALADALTVLPAANKAVAVGDPQQLAAPIQAAHEAEAKVSLLEHLIGDQPVIAPAAGVFLNVSHRMCNAVCHVVGSLAYESSLVAADAANRRTIEGPTLSVAGVEIPMVPGVWHLPVEGGEDEQVAAALAVAEHLTNGQVRAGDSSDEASLAPLGPDEILVVAPHNATVNRLRVHLERFGVGTVDKFQGRQAHVVVYVMGREAAEARDVPFLYELNRVNVALSRARLIAVVVTSSDALLPPIAEPHHLLLASRFTRAMAGV